MTAETRVKVGFNKERLDMTWTTITEQRRPRSVVEEMLPSFEREAHVLFAQP